MNAESLRPPELPFNPAMFVWARNWRQRSVEDAAKRLNTKAETVRAWESGEARPTVRQARNLADFYERSFLEFFLSRPPAVRQTELVPDFRMHRGVKPPREHQTLLSVQAWAERLRLNALDLYDMAGESPPEFPLNLAASAEDSPEVFAVRAREEAAFHIDAQLALAGAERDKLPSLVRSGLERLGVLTLRNTALKDVRARGLCIVASPLPVVVYGGEAPAAQAFTMAHELGHVVRGQSGISGSLNQREETPDTTIEHWCNRFAGAFLIPADTLNRIWPKPNSSLDTIDDTRLRTLAGQFKVSRHAILIRLVHLGYVEANHYWDDWRPRFLEEEASFKAQGRPKYYGSRFVSSAGNLYTGLVLSAWDNDIITNHKAAELMGTTLRHIDDIRREFRSL